ncbi:MAG: Hpt domain-containing protein [Pseudomonadota bacterium]
MAMRAGKKISGMRIADQIAPDSGVAADGGISAAVRRARDAVAELSADYRSWALADLTRAEAALSEASADPARAGTPLQRLYGIAHDMKGQGGSFGFPLVTQIGHSLCCLLHGRAAGRREIGLPIDEADLALVEIHLKALRLVLEKSVRGEGGEIGRRLVERLQAAVAEDR